MLVFNLTQVFYVFANISMKIPPFANISISMKIPSPQIANVFLLSVFFKKNLKSVKIWW